MNYSVKVFWMWGSDEIKSFESEKAKDDFLERNADEIFEYSFAVKEKCKNDYKIDAVYTKSFGGMSDYEMDMYL